MTLRYSNTGWLTVLPLQPLVNVGWEARVVAPEDWSTTLARITRYSALSLSLVANEFGYGSVSIPAEDRVFTDPLPAGWEGSILDREALWKIYENGVFRGEFLGQLVEEDIVSERGEPFTQISGQGTEVVLSWGKMVPQTVTLPEEEGGTVSFVPQEFLDQPAVNAILWFIEHVQARGVIPFVSLLFDAEQDSKGQPWSDQSDVIISPGENPLSLLQRLSESLGWEFRMLEGFKLFLAQGGAGVHRETDVKVFIGGDQREHTRKSSTREVVTDVYATASDGTVARAVGTSDATPHKRESWVQAGDAGGITGASRVANATLTLYKDKRVGRTVQVITNRPGRIPFVDFDIEDWISVEDEKFRTDQVKVTGIAVKVDDAAQVTYELQIQTKFEAASVELAKIAAKMGGTTLAGSSTSTIQIEQVAATRLKITSLSDVGTGQSDRDALLWDETEQKWLPGVPGARTLTELDNVDTSSIPATGDVVLGYDRDTETWVPVLDQVGDGGGGGSSVLTAPDGGTWALAVANDGTLSTVRLTFGQTYADVLADMGAVRYWDLSETSGNFQPVIGSDQIAVAASGLTRGTSGPLGIGDGTMTVASGRHTIPRGELGTTSWTVALWVYGTGVGTGDRSLFGTNGFRCYYLYGTSHRVRPYGFSWNTEAGPSFTAGAWHLVVIGSDATAGVRYWYDGTIAHTHATPVQLVTGATDPAQWGANGYGSETFNGPMAHPATWDRLLTDQEVADLWAYAGGS